MINVTIRGLFAAACVSVSTAGWAQDSEAPTPSPTSAAARHIERCLERESIRFRYMPDTDAFRVLWRTKAWTNGDGELAAPVVIKPDLSGDVVMWIPQTYDLSLCAHIGACRKVMAEAYWKADLRRAQLAYDPVDAEVRAVTRAPGQAGRIDAKQLRALMEGLVRGVDDIHPVMLKAMDTGNVDWPSDDTGPERPEREFTVTVEGLDPFRVGVASWVEPEIFASTLLTFEDFGKQLVNLNDEEAELFGAELFGPYRDGPLAWSVYQDWSAFWAWVKQHYPPIAVRVWGPPGLTIRGTLSCDGYLSGSCAAEAMIDRSGSTELNFSPDWNEDALLRVAAARNMSMRISLDVPGATMEPAEVALTPQTRLHPVGVAQMDMPLTLPMAMHVNEEHPWIDGLLREAKRTGMCTSLGSLPDTSPAEQVRQVFAVWKALRDRGITYSNIAFADSARRGQRVRSLHECIAGEQANCFDGVAAFASLLKALDFDVRVVAVPQHTFLVVSLNEDQSGGDSPAWLAIETTVIGSEFGPGEMDNVDALDRVESALRPTGDTAADWRSFEAACVLGMYAFSQAMEDRSLRMVPVALLRQCGLRAIPALKSEIGSLPPAPSLDSVVRERKKRDAIEDRERKALKAEAPAPQGN